MVLVWKLDRFARNRFDAVNYKYQLEKNGVHLVSAMEPISQGPEGIMVESMLIGSLRGQEGYFPAYHMNKEKWLSIQLGKPELDDAIKDLLSLSHELTAPKKRNLKSSGKNPGDSANGKEKEIDEG